MRQQEIQLLSDIYENYIDTNKRECSISFVHTSPQEKHNILNSLEYLEESGYIRFTARASGFCQFKITIPGIKFVENGFKEPESTAVVQGDNSIYVSGSSNTVSGNYNKVSVDIANADLPPETKELIEAFLYEMKNPHLSPEKKSDKIKSFLSDISSGTISGLASTGLTALFISLFNQIPL